MRRAGEGGDREDDAARAHAMQAQVFGGPGPSVQELLRSLADPEQVTELWLAEVDGEVVSAGRLDVVPGTRFAGLWGGATLEAFRGRGIYRALTAARAASALSRGYSLLQSDCTEMSRPILERSGLVPVTTTTPYNWTRHQSAVRDAGADDAVPVAHPDRADPLPAG